MVTLSSDKLQLGFKTKLSCNDVPYVMHNITKYFISRGPTDNLMFSRCVMFSMVYVIFVLRVRLYNK